MFLSLCMKLGFINTGSFHRDTKFKTTVNVMHLRGCFPFRRRFDASGHSHLGSKHEQPSWLAFRTQRDAG